MLAPPLASTISSVMALGFTACETIPIVFIGFTICSVVITLTGKMGATYAVLFPVIIRSIFGMYGSFPTIFIRDTCLDRAFTVAGLTPLSICRIDLDYHPHYLSRQLFPTMLRGNLTQFHQFSEPSARGCWK